MDKQANGHDLGSALDAIWERCAGHLGPALEHAGNTDTLENVRAAIENGFAQLWPVGEEGTIVSEIVDTPAGKRFCRLWLAGGTLKALVAAERVVSAWAAEQGCETVEIVGRRGWERVLPEYRHAAVVLRRDLKEQGL